MVRLITLEGMSVQWGQEAAPTASQIKALRALATQAVQAFDAQRLAVGYRARLCRICRRTWSTFDTCNPCDEQEHIHHLRVDIRRDISERLWS